MADIVELGFKVDSGDLKTAETRLDALDSTGKRAETRAGSLAGGFGKLALAAGAAAGALGLGALVSGTAGYIDALGEVSTLVDTATFDMDKLSDAVLRQTQEYGTLPTDGAKAFYQAISAGAGTVAEATDAMDVANRLAVGGVTDVLTAVDGLTSSMNAYGGEAGSFTDISDAMFIAVRAGKALDLDTEIATSNGFVPIKDIQDGDVVYNEDGEPIVVKHAHPVIEDAESYEVELCDGTKIRACKDHNWLTYTDEDRVDIVRADRGDARKPISDRKQSGRRPVAEPTVKTTAEIVGDFKPKTRMKHRHYLPLAKPVKFPAKELPIDPYVLGMWLGDGATDAARFSTADKELLDAFEVAGYAVTKIAGDNYDYGIKSRERGKTPSLLVQLRDEGLIGNKHIPEIYHEASIEQRLAILQGLMDTDGYIEKKGICEFVSVTQNLADGVKRLVDSLGMRARINTKEPKHENHRLAYRVLFSPTKFNPFRLDRKRARVKASYTKKDYIAIVAIRKIENRPMRCLTVSGDSALFLAGRNFVVTHNTTIGELSGSIGKLAPIAATAGVSLDEVLAATGALTKGGVATATSMDGLRAIIAATIKPSSEAAKMAASVGLEFNAAALESKGLAGFLSDVADKTGGSTEKMAQLFGGVEALTPALALVGASSADFAEILGDMADKSGATQAAFDKMVNSPGFQMARIKGSFSAGFTDLTKQITEGSVPAMKAFADYIPIAFAGVNEVIGTIKTTFSDLSGAFEQSKIGAVVKSIGDSLSPVIPYLDDFAGAFVAVGATATAIALVAAGIGAIAAVVLSPVVLSIGAVAAGALLIRENWESITAWWSGLWDGLDGDVGEFSVRLVKSVGSMAIDFIKAGAAMAVEFGLKIGIGINDAIDSIDWPSFSEIMAGANRFILAFGELALVATGALVSGIYNALRTLASDIEWPTPADIGRGAAQLIVGFVELSADAVSALVDGISNAIKSAPDDIEWPTVGDIAASARDFISGFVSAAAEATTEFFLELSYGLGALVKAMPWPTKAEVLGSITDLLAAFKQVGLNLVAEFVKGIAGLGVAARDSFVSAFDFLPFIGDDLKATTAVIGEDTAEGFWGALKAAKNKVVDATKEMVGVVEPTAQSELEIQSPSRVMMRIGAFVVEGLAVGIAENTSSVSDAVKNFTDDMRRDFTSGLQRSIESATTVKDAFNSLGGFLRSWLKEQISHFAANKIMAFVGLGDTSSVTNGLTSLLGGGGNVAASAGVAGGAAASGAGVTSIAAGMTPMGWAAGAVAAGTLLYDSLTSMGTIGDMIREMTAAVKELKAEYETVPATLKTTSLEVIDTLSSLGVDATAALGVEMEAGMLEAFHSVSVTVEGFGENFKQANIAAYQYAFEQLGPQVQSLIDDSVDIESATLEEIQAAFAAVQLSADLMIPSLEAVGLKLTGTADENIGYAARLAEGLGGTTEAMNTLDLYAREFATTLTDVDFNTQKVELREFNESLTKNGASVGLLNAAFGDTYDGMIDTRAEAENYIQTLLAQTQAMEASGVATEAGREHMNSLTVAAFNQLDAIIAVEDAQEAQTAALIARNEQQAASVSALTDAAGLLNLNFDASSPLAIQASDSLIELMGGIEALNSATNAYYNEYYDVKEREQIELAASALQVQNYNDQIVAAGGTAITSKEQFRQYVESLDLTTAAGQNAFVAAMDVQASFAEVANSGQNANDIIGQTPDTMLNAATSVAIQSGNMASSITGATDSATSAMANFSSAISGFGSQAQRAANDAISAGNSISSALSKASNIQSQVDYWTQSVAANGSHSSGLYSVPFDGYLAETHKGEMIPNASISDQLRQMGVTENSIPADFGRSSNETSFSAPITNVNNNANTAALEAKIEEQTRKMNEMGDKLASALDRVAGITGTVADNTNQQASKQDETNDELRSLRRTAASTRA